MTRTRLAALRTRIEAAALAAGRLAADVRLIGVAKTRTPDEIVVAVAAGLTDIGENYLDESLPAIAAVAAAGLACNWHFIGHVQGNKTRAIAHHYAWVHTLDRSRIADRLAAQRDAAQPPLQVLIQTNFDGEASKSGVTADGALLELARHVLTLPSLRLRGLMTIPPPGIGAAAALASFTRTREALAVLRETLRAEGDAAAADALDTLSMGMSDDLEPAVAAGSTMVRVGTALFGARPAKAPTREHPPAEFAAGDLAKREHANPHPTRRRPEPSA